MITNGISRVIQPEMIAFQLNISSWSWDNSVFIVTRLRAGRQWFNSRQGKGFFSSPPPPDRLWGPRSPLSNEYRGSFPGGEGCKADGEGS